MFGLMLAPYLLNAEKKAEAEAEETHKTHHFTGIYVVVPDILVNLQGSKVRGHFLKLALTFEALKNEDAKMMNEAMPHVVDAFLLYLRELRLEDLQGAEGLIMLRQQLFERANAIFAPVAVNAVLFREILVQ